MLLKKKLQSDNILLIHSFFNLPDLHILCKVHVNTYLVYFIEKIKIVNLTIFWGCLPRHFSPLADQLTPCTFFPLG